MRHKGSGLDGQSFMSNTGIPEGNMGGAIGPMAMNAPPRASNDGLRGSMNQFIQKSNSVSGDIQMSMKRPGTASNIDFNRASF